MLHGPLTFDDIVNLFKNGGGAWGVAIAFWVAILGVTNRVARKKISMQQEAEKAAFEHAIEEKQKIVAELDDRHDKLEAKISAQFERQVRILKRSSTEFRELLTQSMRHSDEAVRWISVLEAALADRPDLLRQKPELGRSVTVADVAAVFAEQAEEE